MWKYILAYHFKHSISGETEVAPCLFDFPVQAHLFKQAPWDFSVILLGGVLNSAVALQAPSRVIAAAPGPLPATAQQARGSTGATAGVWAKGKYWAGPPQSGDTLTFTLLASPLWCSAVDPQGGGCLLNRPFCWWWRVPETRCPPVSPPPVLLTRINPAAEIVHSLAPLYPHSQPRPLLSRPHCIHPPSPAAPY